MRDRRLGRDDPLVPILYTKLESALVMFRDDIPENVATLSSRVTFSVDGRDPDTRVISHDPMSSTAGLFLPISRPRGLALLGLAEGQAFRLINSDGVEERIMLEKVHYQPEAVRREKELMSRMTTGPRRLKPALRLIVGAVNGEPWLVPAGPDGSDDPGPSAA